MSKEKGQSIMKLKAEIFDLLKTQQPIQMRLNQIENVKQQKLKELLTLENEK